RRRQREPDHAALAAGGGTRCPRADHGRARRARPGQGGGGVRRARLPDLERIARVGDRGDRRGPSRDPRHDPAGRPPAAAARTRWYAPAVPPASLVPRPSRGPGPVAPLPGPGGGEVVAERGERGVRVIVPPDQRVRVHRRGITYGDTPQTV